jgi:glutamyl-tRNA synthetase
MEKNVNEYQNLAELLFPEIKNTPEEYEIQYPQRNLPEGTIVSRYAPSPTGFIHLGALYASLIEGRMARQSGGVFFLRIEDTDKKREIADGVSEIVNALKTFGIDFDEGALDVQTEKGGYGPYTQSKRAVIYKTFVKELIRKGMAYPCFCTELDMDELRKKQEDTKLKTGYYGEWAIHRNYSLDKIKEELAKGKPFIIRFKSPGNPERKFTHKDLIKGRVDLYENDQDIVLIKSDGLPTYHFAHIVDDHLMRTTHVIRGDEWFASVPLHYQLFQAMGWQPPQYAHIAPIVKEDGGSKRKLSKRKDPEAAVSYYHQLGFPKNSIIEYLLNIANSGFEDWRKANPKADNRDFKLDFKKMSISGALFDMVKLMDISKNIISNFSADEVYEESVKWADEFDGELKVILSRDPAYTKKIFSIDRSIDKPRKDIAKWSDVRNFLAYFFDELSGGLKNSYDFPENIAHEDIKSAIALYITGYMNLEDKKTWFDRVKEMSEKLGFAGDMKAFKQNPGQYKGNVGDISTIIRVALTGRRNTPDLYEIQVAMGIENLKKRFTQCLGYLARISHKD